MAAIRSSARERAHLAHQLARTTALDHFRAEQVSSAPRARLCVDWQPAEDGLFGGLSPALEKALGELSAGERGGRARVLLDLDGESAANVLGISVTNCNTRSAGR